MGLLTVKSILLRASTIVNDTTNILWPEPEMLNWFNDAQREVTLLRPDSNAINATMNLVAGTKQSIPADGIRLIDITRNMGVAGTPLPGAAIRIVDREVLDAQKADWHMSASGNIQHYVFDNRDPKTFYVYSPAAGTEAVEIVYSANPADVIPTGGLGTALTGTEVIFLDDIYGNTLLDYILYRAYLKDTNYAGNANRALAHYQAFSNSLGIQNKIKNIEDPNAQAAPFNTAAAASAQ